MTAPQVRGVLVVILDDFRDDDLAFMPLLSARIAAGCVDFRRHYSDDGSCAPTRRGALTGHPTTWHKRDQDVDTYYKYCAQAQRIGADDQTYGPWEYPTSETRAGDANPDTEWSSGGLVNWLRDDGVITGLVGKYDHGYADEKSTGLRDYTLSSPVLGDGGWFDGTAVPICVGRVPADWDFWSCHVGDDSDWDGGEPNQWRHHKALKAESNVTNLGPDFVGGNEPGDVDPAGGVFGVDVAPDGWADVVEYRQYDLLVSGSVTATQVSGVWYATLQVGAKHRIQVGDLISVANLTSTGPGTYNTTAPSASPSPGVAGTPGTEVVVTAVTSTTVTYAVEGNTNPGTWTGGVSPTVYPRRNLGTWTDAYDFIDWLGTRERNDRWFGWLAFSAPHPNETSATEAEYRYHGTIDPDDFYMKDGTPGAYSTLIDSGHASFNAAKNEWASKMEMCRTLDDALEAVFDSLATNGVDDRTTVIITADQGVMYGERDFYTNGGGALFVKRLAFEGVRAPCWMFHPHLPAQSVLAPTYCADLAPTILDLFGLTTHHCHTKREGVSLLRIIDDHPYPDRAIWIYHDPKDQPGVDSIVTPDGYKWIAQSDATSPGAGYVEFLFDLDTDPGELTNLAPSWSGSPSLATFAARAAALELAQGPDRNADWTTL